MKNRFLFANPKGLDLDSLRNTKKRVTLGLKCNPSLKLSLAEDAFKRGMKLSQHVEDLLQDNQARMNQKYRLHVKGFLDVTLNQFANHARFVMLLKYVDKNYKLILTHRHHKPMQSHVSIMALIFMAFKGEKFW